MKTFILLVATLVTVHCVDVGKYLQEFGYYNPNSFDQSNLKDAIKKFQNTFGLAPTGEVDDATNKLMHTPRCGLPDHGTKNAFADTAWRKKALTYYFNNYTPDLSRSDVESLTRRALKFWSDVTPLQFSYRQGGDIVIAFGSGGHSDGRRTCGYPFKGGRGGVLAHAFFPPDGRLHFDEAERWTKGSGTNYLGVATHELGHILGLEHDQNTRDAIMYPYFIYNANMKLHQNDIRRIQRLYGSGTGGTGTGGTGTGGGNCRDRVNDCYKYTRYCNTTNQSWQNYMNQSCKKTCSKC